MIRSEPDKVGNTTVITVYEDNSVVKPRMIGMGAAFADDVSFKMEMPMDPCLIYAFMGSRGSNINELQRRQRVKLLMDGNVLEIRGSQRRVDAARVKIRDWIEQWQVSRNKEKRIRRK